MKITKTNMLLVAVLTISGLGIYKYLKDNPKLITNMKKYLKKTN